MARTWPLTGRGTELAAARSALGTIERPRGIVLCGSAGVGKTRLAREVLAAAASRGASVRWVAGTASARGMPFGAFAPVVELPSDLNTSRMLRDAAEALGRGAGPLRPGRRGG